MLAAEISTIYRGGDRQEKVRHLPDAPTFEAADRIGAALSKARDPAADGRPIPARPPMAVRFQPGSRHRRRSPWRPWPDAI
jgi:hypothetical protein